MFLNLSILFNKIINSTSSLNLIRTSLQWHLSIVNKPYQNSTNFIKNYLNISDPYQSKRNNLPLSTNMLFINQKKWIVLPRLLSKNHPLATQSLIIRDNNSMITTGKKEWSSSGKSLMTVSKITLDPQSREKHS